VADLQVAWQRDPTSPTNLNGVHDGPLGSSTMEVYPTGWFGRMAAGRSSDPNVIQRGSVIEASFIGGLTTVDVSYVKGFQRFQNALRILDIVESQLLSSVFLR